MNKNYILVIDSGVGGLSVLANLVKTTGEKYIYFADTKHAPYGKLKKKEIINILTEIIEIQSKKHNIKSVILACNTATTSSINTMKRIFPKIDFEGVFPAIDKAFYSGFKKILVLCTKATSKQHFFKKLKLKFKCKVLVLDDFATNIENFLLSKTISSKIALKKNLYKIKATSKNFDSIVLGCTHYSVIHKMIENYSNLPCLDNCEKFMKSSSYPQKINKSSQLLFINSSDEMETNQKYKKILSQILANEINLC